MWTHRYWYQLYRQQIASEAEGWKSNAAGESQRQDGRHRHRQRRRAVLVVVRPRHGAPAAHGPATRARGGAAGADSSTHAAALVPGDHPPVMLHLHRARLVPKPKPPAGALDLQVLLSFSSVHEQSKQTIRSNSPQDNQRNHGMSWNTIFFFFLKPKHRWRRGRKNWPCNSSCIWRWGLRGCPADSLALPSAAHHEHWEARVRRKRRDSARMPFFILWWTVHQKQQFSSDVERLRRLL